MNSNDLTYMVSNTDIKNKIQLPRGAKFVLLQYPELANYKDITELLPKKLSVAVILLETAQNTGHWTCLVRTDNIIYYFDSYGVRPDGEFRFIDPQIRSELNEKPFLSNLLNMAKQQGFTIDFNKAKLQSKSPTVNTCGKHVLAFVNAVLNGSTLNEYVNYLKAIKKSTKWSFDQIVNGLYQKF